MKKISMLVVGYVIGAFSLIGLKVCTQYVIDRVGGFDV